MCAKGFAQGPKRSKTNSALSTASIKARLRVPHFFLHWPADPIREYIELKW